MTTKIEWTDETWHRKTAAKRIGISLEEYVARIASGEKWCTFCKAWHPRTIFGVDKSRGDGLSASCRGRANRHPPPSREERRARANEAYRRYYAGPAGASIRERARARKRGLDAIPAWWREEQLERGCAYCGDYATTIDHVIPVADGGKSEPGNLVPACGTCNSKKKHSDPVPWIDRMRTEFIEQIAVRPLSGCGALERLGVL